MIFLKDHYIYNNYFLICAYSLFVVDSRLFPALFIFTLDRNRFWCIIEESLFE